MKDHGERLPLPVHTILDDALDEASLMRAYRKVEARRATRAPRRGTIWLVAAAALVAVAAMIFWTRRPVEGPIALASGAPLSSLDANAAGMTITLDDASTITLERGAQVSPLENGPDRVALVVERGRAHFEVTPGGKRRWSIETGLATVEIVGTGFTVDRDEARVRVEVTHGVVLVRGDSVEGRVKRLEAGDALEIVDPRHRTAEAPSVPALAPTASAAPSLSGSSAAAAAPAWRTMASRGAYGEAYALLGEGGIRGRAQGASVDELFLLADVARLSGHPGEALVPLAKIVERHPTDARAPLAAFTLGKLQQSQSPAAAAQAFERAIALGLSASLRGDASARWLEACARIADAACEARARQSAGLPAAPASATPTSAAPTSSGSTAP